MTILRLIADLLHLLSFIILILKIRSTKNCTGLSYKTQEVYLVVFLTRYWDLFLYFVSLYNTTMKLFFIGATVYTIYLMKFKRPYCLTYEEACDDFDHRRILYPGNKQNILHSCIDTSTRYSSQVDSIRNQLVILHLVRSHGHRPPIKDDHQNEGC